jgi:hypothetical protein
VLVLDRDCRDEQEVVALSLLSLDMIIITSCST